eukprot:g5437.t1
MSIIRIPLLVGVAVAGVATGDEVTSLPGWRGALPSRHYSGFLPTTPSGNRSLHYYFAESESEPATDPVVLWVQGGPGGSSMEGFFTEIGPFSLNELSLGGGGNGTTPRLFRNPYAWTRRASVLAWESPAGVGFSPCGSLPEHAGAQCPHWNDTVAAADNAAFLCNFFRAFPAFRANNFFIAGESYAGVYIPMASAVLIDQGLSCPGEAGRAAGEDGSFKINLAGVAIGNGCTGTDVGPCSPARGQYTLDFLLARGLASAPTAAAVRVACAGSANLTAPSPACVSAVRRASAEVGPYLSYDVFDSCGGDNGHSEFAPHLCGWIPGSAWCNETEEYSYPRERAELSVGAAGGATAAAAVAAANARDAAAAVTALPPTPGPAADVCACDAALSAYLSRADVQAAMHVLPATGAPTPWPAGRSEFPWQYTRTEPDVIAYTPRLLAAGVRVLIYSGDFDGQIPTAGTEAWTRSLGYGVREPWRTWTARPGARGAGSGSGGAPTAGSVMRYNTTTEFTLLTIRGAGHMAPRYKPLESFAMIERFLYGSPYWCTEHPAARALGPWHWATHESKLRIEARVSASPGRCGGASPRALY